MKYITGIFALNLECSLETTGDWHTYALDWNKMQLEESDESIFKDYGIEKCNKVPEHDGEYYIANTLRALLDLLVQEKYFYFEGAKEDFICNDKYTSEFFDKVWLLRNNNNWSEIYKYMQREYMMEWVDFVKDKENEH